MALVDLRLPVLPVMLMVPFMLVLVHGIVGHVYIRAGRARVRCVGPQARVQSREHVTVGLLVRTQVAVHGANRPMSLSRL